MSALALGVLLLATLGAVPAEAQDEHDAVPQQGAWTAAMVPVDEFAARAPFGPGEHLVYKVKVGIFNAGYGFMTVHGTEAGEASSWRYC